MSVPVLGLCGSLREDSSNGRLLRAAATLAPAPIALKPYNRQLAALPAFTPDLDGEGSTPPAAVAELRRLVAGAAGVLISCPEYAHGVPGAFKNALDWLVSSGELGGKPTALLMASPGGAAQAGAALVPTLEVMEARLVFTASVVVTRSHFDAGGRLVDPEVATVVRESVAALLTAIGRGARSAHSRRQCPASMLRAICDTWISSVPA